MMLELLAASTGLFAGAAIYINLVEHPARMRCGPLLAVAEFGPSYERAAVMQAALAAVGLVCGAWRWAQGGGAAWLVAALAIGGVIPFTLAVIRPVNTRLLALPRDRGSPEAADLLARWARLHAVRSAASLVAFVIYLLLLVGR